MTRQGNTHEFMQGDLIRYWHDAMVQVDDFKNPLPRGLGIEGGQQWRKAAANVGSVPPARVQDLQCLNWARCLVTLLSTAAVPQRSGKGDEHDRLVTAGAANCALTLLGFSGQGDATTRVMLKASRRSRRCRGCGSCALRTRR